ncbi:MAG: ATP-binding cassette domain-containing protein [Pseudomonadales bacterium]|nr:ATP-binding cassette domain-containing protein [Pseudomonadales bacterium]
MTAAVGQRRRWLCPEVVQTSSMDCGPAALKCLLEGFGIPASYGRLREVCQTSVDGTSIDDIEFVANRLGARSEQQMLPLDHLSLRTAPLLPAMVVTRQPDGGTHFVVVWRRHGNWLQVMDPAAGRRWLPIRRFEADVFRHRQRVPASAWREWSASEEGHSMFSSRLLALGMTKVGGQGLLQTAEKDSGWFGYAALDASIRLVQSLVDAGGVQRGRAATALLESLLLRIDPDDIYRDVPLAYWSVEPQQRLDGEERMLVLEGAVLLRLSGVRPAQAPLPSDEGVSPQDAALARVLGETPFNPLSEFRRILKAGGLTSPWLLFAAVAVAAAAVLLETLLFRGMFDIAWDLRVGSQRMLAAGALLIFVVVLFMLELPVLMESMRLGRHVEAQLRLLLARRLPELDDRYFQSRPVSDMAERGHGIATTRAMPSLLVQFAQTLWNLVFTLAGIGLIAPGSVTLAALAAALAILLPATAQSLLNERDLRMRNHGGALFRFYLDVLIGLNPVRVHHAEAAVRRQHEGLLVEWVRAGRRLIAAQLFGEGLQSLLCLAPCVYLLWSHLGRVGSIGGGDLLLVFWVLKLPALGAQITQLAQRFPAQRNTLLRLLEPLSGEQPPAPQVAPRDQPAPAAGASAVSIRDGEVKIGGHVVLDALNLDIRAGEHVAIVGQSGSGKSTLLGLLLGWHRLSAGTLHVDGRAFGDAEILEQRAATAWVDPAVQIWNRSFLDNIAYGIAQPDLERLGAAIDAAALREVLRKLPEGLQTLLGESGGLLSGGEGQRLRTGRALLQEDCRLVLLDEPFRGLDRQQRRQLMTTARQWWRDATLLCVTHDIQETRMFDRVLVVEGGRVVEDGAPRALQAGSTRYRALLDAEVDLHLTLWRDPRWRRVTVADGVAKAAKARSPGA